MSLSLALVALLGQGGALNCPDLPRAPSIEEHPGPVEPSGRGLWIGGLRFEGSDIAEASPVVIPDWETGGVGSEPGRSAWGVDIQFSPVGMAKFRNAQKCRVGRSLEVSRDGEVMSRPILNEPIEAPSIRISLNGSAEEAQRFVREIRSAESTH